ncbi:D-glycerate 2-kinase [compost metagenome]
MGAMSRQVLQSGHPSSAPCVLIGGGETTVHILPGTKPGKGGPNQEWALAVALEIQGNDQVAALGIDTDGTDGPTPFAGGIVDGDTCLHAANLGLDLHACLQRHDVSPALEAMGAAVRTGSTGTNVNDLKLIVISTPKGE